MRNPQAGSGFPIAPPSTLRPCPSKLIHMTLLVRTALVCLLALAMPLQGAVAAAMRCCGMDHHQVGASLVQDQRGHQHSEEFGRGGKLAPHVHTSHAPQHDEPSAQDSGSPNEHSGSHEEDKRVDATKALAKTPVKVTGKCNVCASCCGAAALPSEAPALAPTEVEKDRHLPSVTPDPEFGTAGPERPPRTSFL